MLVRHATLSADLQASEASELLSDAASVGPDQPRQCSCVGQGCWLPLQI